MEDTPRPRGKVWAPKTSTLASERQLHSAGQCPEALPGTAQTVSRAVGSRCPCPGQDAGRGAPPSLASCAGSVTSCHSSPIHSRCAPVLSLGPSPSRPHALLPVPQGSQNICACVSNAFLKVGRRLPAAAPCQSTLFRGGSEHSSASRKPDMVPGVGSKLKAVCK